MNNFIVTLKFVVLFFSFVQFANATNLGVIDDFGDTQQNLVGPTFSIYVGIGAVNEADHKRVVSIVDEFKRNLNKKYSNSKIKVVVSNSFTSHSLIEDLRDTKYSGLILIGHGYSTQTGTELPDSDLRPLPKNILSVLNPFMKFVAMFSCKSKGTTEQYEVRSQLEKVPGRQLFYYSKSSELSTVSKIGGIIPVPYLGNRLKWLSDEIRPLVESYDTQKLALDEKTKLNYADDHAESSFQSFDGKLSLEIRDVKHSMENRIISVNGMIVNTLGSSRTSNDDGSWKHLTIPVRNWILSERPVPTIEIRSVDMSYGAPFDDYLLRNVVLINESNKILGSWLGTEQFQDGAHFGDDRSPYIGEELPQVMYPNFLRYRPDTLPRKGVCPELDTMRSRFSEEDLLKQWKIIFARTQKEIAQKLSLVFKSRESFKDEKSIVTWPLLVGRFFSSHNFQK